MPQVRESAAFLEAFNPLKHVANKHKSQVQHALAEVLTAVLMHSVRRDAPRCVRQTGWGSVDPREAHTQLTRAPRHGQAHPGRFMLRAAPSRVRLSVRSICPASCRTQPTPTDPVPVARHMRDPAARRHCRANSGRLEPSSVAPWTAIIAKLQEAIGAWVAKSTKHAQVGAGTPAAAAVPLVHPCVPSCACTSCPCAAVVSCWGWACLSVCPSVCLMECACLSWVTMQHMLH
jgi:hypothetical protein